MRDKICTTTLQNPKISSKISQNLDFVLGSHLPTEYGSEYYRSPGGGRCKFQKQMANWKNEESVIFDLLYPIFQRNPEQRPTMEEVLEILENWTPVEPSSGGCPCMALT